MKSSHVILIVLCTVPLTISLAQAMPRDDMLAGISRCGVITDDKTFLNCVYGAAQPVRAELGLQPAPITQQNLVPRAAYNPGLPVTTPAAPASTPAKEGWFDWLWPF